MFVFGAIADPEVIVQEGLLRKHKDPRPQEDRDDLR